MRKGREDTIPQKKEFEIVKLKMDNERKMETRMIERCGQKNQGKSPHAAKFWKRDQMVQTQLSLWLEETHSKYNCQCYCVSNCSNSPL